MVILSLKMDQCPFRLWYDEFSSNNIMLVGVKNDIHRYQMVLKVLINISRLDQVGYQDTG
jgi:hypothetical protein